MRIGEALRLVLQDVDLTDQVITVRDTKFFKTRLVPIGPKLNQELVEYVERRRRLPLPRGQESPLFTTRGSRPWHYVRVISWFSMSAGPPESVALSASLDLHGCTIFATQPRCTG